MSNGNEVNVEQEFQRLTEDIVKRGRRGNGPTEPAREGVAEDLAQFIEKHAADILKEAQDLLHDAKSFADEIRQRTDQKAAELRAFTNSIKDTRTAMADIRARFLQSRTSANALDERQPTMEHKVD
jgi:uncharacterized protein YoxC